MEKLLNELLERGWKPFWREYERYAHWCLIYKYKEHPGVFSIWQYPITYRQLVSKESQLWQFVCENGYNQYKKNYFNRFSKYGIKWEYRDTSDFEYYVLESALKDEDELESFILDNIQLWQ